jgi:hypothetical protein
VKTDLQFISLATPRYEAEVIRLESSLRRLDLPFYIERVLQEPKTWFEGVHLRVPFIIRMLKRHRAVVWVDADAIVWEDPRPFFPHCDEDVDIAATCRVPRDYLGGTIWLRAADRTWDVLRRWRKMNEKAPEKRDQFHFNKAMKEVPGLLRRDLCELVCWIYDKPRKNGERPIIEHFQASRHFQWGRRKR